MNAINLSKRMAMVASKVVKTGCVADVGCDHAYIAIYLIRYSVAKKVIATDINKGPLARAKDNVILYGCEDFVDLRLSDGLEKIEPGEADTILISGMGGGLMTDILSAKKECIYQASELVLQPQSEIENVRSFLHKEGYEILEEDMCFDENKFYTVIRAHNVGKNNVTYYNDRLEYKYGKLLLEKKHPVLYDFLKEEYRKALIIEEQLRTSHTETAAKRYPSYMEEFGLLKEAIRVMKEGLL